MAEVFDFIARMIDQISGPAKQAESSSIALHAELAEVNKEITHIKMHPGQFKELEKARKELRAIKKEAGGEGGGVIGGIIDDVKAIRNLESVRMIGEGLHVVAETGLKVVEIVGEIADEFIKATGGEERFRIASDQLFGPLSQSVQEYIGQVAKAGELTDDELKQMVLSLRTSGFEADELGQVLPAALDVGGFLGGGVAKIEAATQALAHMRLTGQASQKQLLALGLSEQTVLEDLKHTTGLSIETLKKQMGEGKLNPKDILHAVYKAIAAKEGGELGTTAEKMGNTIEAKLKKLKGLPDQFFQGLVDSRGFTAFSSFLGDLVEELSPESEFGKQVTAALGEVGNSIADAFGAKGQTGIEATKTIILDIVHAARDAVPIMTSIAGEIAEIAKTALEMIHGYREFKDSLNYASRKLHGGRQELSDDEFNALSGEEMVDYVNHRGRFMQKPTDAIDTGAVNVNSPEWKRYQYGDFTRMPEPVSPLLPSGVGDVKSGESNVTQKAEVNINITGGTKDDADAIGEHVQGSMPGTVAETFHRMAVNQGVHE